MIKKTLNHLNEVKNLKIEGSTRKKAISIIQEKFKDAGIANFIASNVVYDEKTDNKTVKWSVHLDAII